MIERVARAIVAIVAELEDQQLGSQSEWDAEFRENAFRCARAAIEAMREPTDQMIHVGRIWFSDEHANLGSEGEACGVWQDMLNAALK